MKANVMLNNDERIVDTETGLQGRVIYSRRNTKTEELKYFVELDDGTTKTLPAKQVAKAE